MANLQATTISGTLNALITENVKTSSHTLELVDRDKVVAMNNTSSATVTIPANATVALPVGSTVYVCRINTGSVAIAAAGGVTVSKTGSLAANEQITLRKRATDTWVVIDTTTRLTGSGGTTGSTGGSNVHSFTSTGSATFTVS
jgi:hypothetical protein